MKMKLEKIEVIGNWMITLVCLADGEPYISLIPDPKNFERGERPKEKVIGSKKVGVRTAMVLGFQAVLDPFSMPRTANSQGILLAVEREISAESGTVEKINYIEIYKETFSGEEGSLKLLTQVRLPAPSLDYKVLPRSKTSFCLVYQANSAFQFLLYDQITHPGLQLPRNENKFERFEFLENFEVKANHSRQVRNSPDYWTARLESYINSDSQVDYGVLTLTGNYSSSLLTQF